MKVLILSDIHGNIDALEAIEAQVLQENRFDQTWVLGDLVDYGAAPAEAIAWVRAHAAVVVRGNHDHAMGTGEDCRSAALYHDLSVATREYFRPRLSPEDIAYLAGLPLQAKVSLAQGREAVLVHATPQDPLFHYVPGNAPVPAWRAALAPAGAAAWVCVGHTHDQFTREIDRTTLLNPGSVGLPKDGDPRAACAIVEEERVTLRRVAYDVARAASRIDALSLPADHRARLVHLIERGSLA